jgi:hypothetical protein
MAVKGNEWNKTGIEKEFTIVVFADVNFVDGKRNFNFNLLSDGTTSAKTPPIFLPEGKEVIPNDCNDFLNSIRNTLNNSKE